MKCPTFTFIRARATLLAIVLVGCGSQVAPSAAVRVVVPTEIALSEAPIPKVDVAEVPQIDSWQKPLRRCAHYGARFYCNGPRWVPEPHGEAKDRAERLGLGTIKAARKLLTRAPGAELQSALAQLDVTEASPLSWPVKDARFVRGFGHTRRDPQKAHILHKGIDLAAARGTHVTSIADGVVAYADNELRGYGNLLIIVHADGQVSSYAHLQRAFVFAGQVVRAGQIVAEVGNTGLSKGPHLHMELRARGKLVDPMRHLNHDG